MIKISVVLGYMFSIRFVAAFASIALAGLDYHFLFPIFCFMLFLPELGFIFVKSFRKWLKDGIEDSDNKFNKEDFNSMLIHYSTAWCIKLFVLFGLLEVFYAVQVREIFVIGTLAGAFGIEAVNFFIRRNEKK